MDKTRNSGGVSTGPASQKEKARREGPRESDDKNKKVKKEFDPVDEASKESFPASDAPAW